MATATAPYLKTIRIKGGDEELCLLETRQHGGSHVWVRIQKLRYDRQASKKAEKRVMKHVGFFEGVGGFTYAKDFDYDIAERAAIEVASEKEKQYGEG